MGDDGNKSISIQLLVTVQPDLRVLNPRLMVYFNTTPCYGSTSVVKWIPIKFINFNTTPCYGSTLYRSYYYRQKTHFNTTPCYGSTDGHVSWSPKTTLFQYNSLLRFNRDILGNRKQAEGYFNTTPCYGSTAH